MKDRFVIIVLIQMCVALSCCSGHDQTQLPKANPPTEQDIASIVFVLRRTVTPSGEQLATLKREIAALQPMAPGEPTNGLGGALEITQHDGSKVQIIVQPHDDEHVDYFLHGWRWSNERLNPLAITLRTRSLN